MLLYHIKSIIPKMTRKKKLEGETSENIKYMYIKCVVVCHHVFTKKKKVMKNYLSVITLA